MSDLIIVESPSKAKTLKSYLGKGYNIVASKGHVRDLPAARLSVDIKHDFAPKYSIVKGKEKLVKELKDMLGIYAVVKVVEPKTITRSEGKAKRVIDKRDLYAK